MTWYTMILIGALSLDTTSTAPREYQKCYSIYGGQVWNISFIVHRDDLFFVTKEIKSYHIRCTHSKNGIFKKRSQSQVGCSYLMKF